MYEFDAVDGVIDEALEMMAGRRGWSVGFNAVCGHITTHHANGSVTADAAIQPGLWIVHTTAGLDYSKREVQCAELAAFILGEMRRVEDSAPPAPQVADFPY
jgi:hypothetical protein